MGAMGAFPRRPARAAPAGERGISLVFAMMLGGALAGLAATVAEMTRQVAAGRRDVASARDLSQLETEIRSLLQDHCSASMVWAAGDPTMRGAARKTTRTFKKSAVNDRAAGEGREVELWFGGAGGARSGSVAFGPGTKFGDAVVNSLALVLDAEPAAAHPPGATSHEDSGHLYVSVTRGTGGGAAGRRSSSSS